MAAELNMRLHWTIAGIVMLIDILLVAAVLYMDKAHPREVPASGVDTSAIIGWLSAVGGIFIFGCYGVLVKTPSVEKANVDCMVFQVYMSLSCAFVSFIIWMFAGMGESSGPIITGSSFFMGVVFGVIWIGAQVLAFNGISILGYAVAPAIWIGTTIVTSFVWGSAVFGNTVSNWPLAIGSLAVLLMGVALATYSSMVSDREKASKEEKSLNPQETKGEGSKGSPLFGLVCAILMGIANGSGMVPMTCFGNGCPSLGVSKYEGESLASVAFLPSLAVGVLVAQPVIFLLYWGPSIARGVYPQFHAKDVALPAMLTGCYWSMGNFASMFATLYLGQTIGFPLTQCCLIINGGWGILYYKEVQGCSAISIFGLASVVLMSGALMDGLSA